MGYRSDVTIVMYPKRKEDFAALKLYVDENLPDEFEVHEDDNHTKGFKYLLLELDSIKWYEGYEEVDVYTRTFSEWEDMFRDGAEPESETIFHYEFMRIGENQEDVHYERCSYWSSYGNMHLT
jgi:hypothetical protein